MNPDNRTLRGDQWQVDAVCIYLSRLLRMIGGVFLVGAGIYVFFDARSQIDESLSDANVIYLQALMRMATVGAISLGAYILSKFLD